jgi:hypothetical protein
MTPRAGSVPADHLTACEWIAAGDRPLGELDLAPGAEENVLSTTFGGRG